jgi:nitroreductase
VDVWEAISRFRAIRSFDARPLEPAALERILAAGRRAPSSKNLQRWQFVVCIEREHLSQLSGVGPFAGHVAGAAAAVALVTPVAGDAQEAESIAFDLGQCAENMMLAAFELGIGSVHATVYEQELVRDLLGYPDGFRCRYLISFGYPADPDVLTRPLRSGGRKPLEEIVHRERW